MSALTADASHVGGHRVQAAEVVQQPAVDAVGGQRRLNGRDVERRRIDGVDASSLQYSRDAIPVHQLPKLIACFRSFDRHVPKHDSNLTPYETRVARHVAVPLSRCCVFMPARRLTPRRPDQRRRPIHAAAAAARPTFKVQVDYVEVDVVVTDKQGNHMRDLKKEDFQVLEDGKAQTISAFTLVDIPIERADRPLFAAYADRA